MLGLAGLVLVGFALRSYRLTGFVLNMDEAHWLIYAMFPELLFEQVRNSFARPDLLFPLLLRIPNELIGPNELAIRVLPVLAGTLSVWPLYRFVAAVTGRSRAGLLAAAMLVVLSLVDRRGHLSSVGSPAMVGELGGRHLANPGRHGRHQTGRRPVEFLRRTSRDANIRLLPDAAPRAIVADRSLFLD